MDFLTGGGISFLLLVIISLLAVALIFEKVLQVFFKLRINVDYFLAYVLKLVESDNFSKAIGLCDSLARHPIGQVVKAALLKANKSDREIERSLEQTATKVVPEIRRRTVYLSLLAHLATLIGLLGTLLGLITAFGAMAAVDPTARSAMLSEGVGTAMRSTVVGLLVAMPCLIAYVVLRTRENHLIEQLDHCAITMLNVLAARNAKLLQDK
ncbi:MAG: hypothetical protein A2284_03210 [Deltaproteobacteria bacterium RIFOXYA12_FULL_61_11]|nr:MAG: hypothetical protein A2284_03210 [Deltaproteobacteria bacterium RIFOXYA12_FULL_61_11]